ncbi:MAG: Gfo/Idh/MocA family oxidoreductase, partial [Phycisphaerae bacterium]
MPDEKPLGLGLIGCGGFGEFCLDAFRAMEQVRIAAVADVYKQAAERLGAKFGVPAHGDPAGLIRQEGVEIVHVATPPGSHHELVMAAIAAGKHVLCEKPLATRLGDADEM